MRILVAIDRDRTSISRLFVGQTRLSGRSKQKASSLDRATTTFDRLDGWSRVARHRKRVNEPRLRLPFLVDDWWKNVPVNIISQNVESKASCNATES